MNEKIKHLKDNIEKHIVGKGEVIDKIIIALISEGHVLLEDVPGVGKTSIAKALADSIDLSFARIQCTSDTTPSDIVGLSIYDMKEQCFKVVPGPAVNNIVLVDELNRTSPKTQSALLEVMEEHSVTIDGKKIPVPEPFIVIGTQNPIEMAGTYPIPESQLDRFTMKLSVGYPDEEASEDMVKRYLEGELHQKTTPVLTGNDITNIQRVVREVKIHENLRRYGVNIVSETRVVPEVLCGASSRALLSMFRVAQAVAFMDDRDYCIPEDIVEASKISLSHRLVLTTEARMTRTTKEDVIRLILQKVKVP